MAHYKVIISHYMDHYHGVWDRTHTCQFFDIVNIIDYMYV